MKGLLAVGAIIAWLLLPNLVVHFSDRGFVALDGSWFSILWEWSAIAMVGAWGLVLFAWLDSSSDRKPKSTAREVYKCALAAVSAISQTDSERIMEAAGLSEDKIPWTQPAPRLWFEIYPTPDRSPELPRVLFVAAVALTVLTWRWSSLWYQLDGQERYHRLRSGVIELASERSRGGGCGTIVKGIFDDWDDDAAEVSASQ